MFSQMWIALPPALNKQWTSLDILIYGNNLLIVEFIDFFYVPEDDGFLAEQTSRNVGVVEHRTKVILTRERTCKCQLSTQHL